MEALIMPGDFAYDVLLGYSTNDNPAVCASARRDEELHDAEQAIHGT